jgi:hypothetical protein
LFLINKGHVYSNDDDTILHPNLWENIKDLDDDFIHFIQSNKDDSIRLKSENVRVNEIDSHNFIVKRSVIGNTIFDITKYEADGYFAVECFNKSNSKKYINKVLSRYNTLR